MLPGTVECSCLLEARNLHIMSFCHLKWDILRLALPQIGFWALDTVAVYLHSSNMKQDPKHEFCRYVRMLDFPPGNFSLEPTSPPTQTHCPWLLPAVLGGGGGRGGLRGADWAGVVELKGRTRMLTRGKGSGKAVTWIRSRMLGL